MKTLKLLFVFIIALTNLTIAQQKKFRIDGFVKDIVTNEALAGANILVYKDSITTRSKFYTGTAANNHGYFLLADLEPGRYFILVRNIGYKNWIKEETLTLSKSEINFAVFMEKTEINLEEIIISDESLEKNVSIIKPSPELLMSLPSLSGSTELFKSLQLLPGVSVASELSNGLYIRGGSPDQNLTLVDGMMLYNPSHIGNFSTTFNSDAIQNIKLLKGGFPAEYGGRLSSVLDISLRSGSKNMNKGMLSLGLLTSSILLEGPIGDKSSYIFSGRAMYYDLIQKNINKKSLVPFYNYFDVNTKFSFDASKDDIISFSSYFSKDRMYNQTSGNGLSYEFNWRNGAFSLNWFNVSSKKVVSNTSINFINYFTQTIIDNSTSNESNSSYFTSSTISDFLFKKNFEISWHKNHKLKSGIDLSLHNYNLLVNDKYDFNLEKDNSSTRKIFSPEFSFYFQNNSTFDFFNLSAGGRLYYFSEQKYFRIEPRININFKFSQYLSLKAAFGTMHQYLHYLNRNDITLPNDLWYPSSKIIKPAKADHFVLGFLTKFEKAGYKIDVEGFYKRLSNIYEFKADAKFQLNNSIDEMLTDGRAEAYGVEFFINKYLGNFSGWIGYTLSFSRRKFPGLNNGKVFSPKYDRLHDASVVLFYKLNDNFKLGLTWVYASGQNITFPNSQYRIADFPFSENPSTQVNYPTRNNYKMPSYHKMDLSFTYDFLISTNESSISLSLLNVYNRVNPFAQYITIEDTNGSDPLSSKKIIFNQISLFPFIPSLAFSIKF